LATLYNILRLNRCARQALDKSHHAAVIFFDIKSAFDSVWQDGLIYKMKDFRLPDYLIHWTISFLYKNTAQIELENQLSRPFEHNSGTPQGSPISPLLYIIFTADSMNATPFGVDYGLYADDTAIFTSSNTTSRVRDRLQESIEGFEKWCASWKLIIQPSKTELVQFFHLILVKNIRIQFIFKYQKLLSNHNRLHFIWELYLTNDYIGEIMLNILKLVLNLEYIYLDT
jgi:hypothetical protein